jgi:hypothetical protein
MQIDAELLKIIFSGAASAATTLFTLGAWFNRSITTLNSRINTLSDSITRLDKILAVQTALFEQHFAQECRNCDKIQ